MKNTLILARKLFDGDTRLEPPGGVAVALYQGRIAYAGPAEQVPTGEWATFHLTDATLLPGLIDMHVHMTMDGSASTIEQTQTDSPSQAMLRAVINAEKQIRNGVTTVRDCGCQGDQAIRLGQAVRQGQALRSPRIFACGQVLCITGGHGTFIGCECDGPDSFRRAARRMLKEGADFLKIISTGGVISKGTQAGAVQMDLEEVAAVVHEAQKVGVPVVTHAHGAEGIRIALNAGVRSIEHASYLDEDGLQLFCKNGAMFTSTLLASQLELDHADELPAYMAEKIRAHMDREHASVRRLIKAGVPALGGTDAGTPFNPHGRLADQLIILMEHGLSDVQALQASTSLAARALNREGELGRLLPGFVGDVLAVDGDPQRDLAALKKVRCVWRDGWLLYSKTDITGRSSNVEN